MPDRIVRKRYFCPLRISKAIASHSIRVCEYTRLNDLFMKEPFKLFGRYPERICSAVFFSGI